MFSLDFPDENGVKLITNTWGIIFMMQAWWAFVLCCTIFVIVSLLTPVPTLEQQHYTFNHSEYFTKIKSIWDYRIIGLIIITLLAVLWVTIENLA